MQKKKSYKLVLLLLASLLSLTACKKVDIGFGEEYAENNLTNIVEIDTFSTSISTVYLDSFATEAKGVTVAGGYTDPYLGRIDAQTYFELSAPTISTSSITSTSVVYDSLFINFHLDSTYYGDTTKPITFYINQLSEEITYPQNNGASTTSDLFNTTSFAYDATPLGETTVTLRPNVSDSFHIKLSDVLGKELFTLLQEGSTTITDASSFLDYFKGLRLSSDANSQVMFGCKDSVTMQLAYHHSPALTVDTLRLKFPLSNTSHHFIHISADRSGTSLASLATLAPAKKNNGIPSSETNNLAFTQPMSGVMLKIRFPTIQDILTLPNYVKLLKAELVVAPLTGSYTLYALPPKLRLSYGSSTNTLGTDISGTTSTGSTGTLYGDLTAATSTGFRTYTYDITSYITSIASDATYYNYNTGLLLTPPSPAFETSPARAIIGDQSNLDANSRIKLVLYYAAVNQNPTN